MIFVAAATLSGLIVRMTITPALWQLKFIIPLDQAAPYAEAIEHLAESISWLDADDDGIAEVMAYSQAGFDRKQVKALLQAVGPAVPRFTLKLLPPTNWLLESYRALPPKRVGKFWIHGSHVTKTPPKGVIPLEVEAATAFGSGEHPTTAGCLQILTDFAKDHTPANVMDMGCGSGILALAAAKMWPKVPVSAVDNDAEAVRVTKVHAKINKVKIKAATGDGYKTPLVKEAGPFELVFANILAEPLIAMAPAAKRAVAKDGFIILAGLIATREKAVMAAYKEQGFVKVARVQTGDWPCLLLQKKSVAKKATAKKAAVKKAVVKKAVKKATKSKK